MAAADDAPPDEPKIPEPLRGDNDTAYVLRDRIWKPPNRQNNWSAFVLVGREGSGKSHTCGSILELVDPTFDADRVFFRVENLLAYIHETPKDQRRGKAVMLDEAGVDMGIRSWYEQEQIDTNKIFQTIRDDNMIVGLTLPALGLLDSQLQTRLHGFCEMRQVHAGDYALWSWKDIRVDREEGRDEIKRKVFPRKTENNRVRKIERCAVGPPSDEWVESYETQKAEFKDEFIESVLEDDDEDDSADPRAIAEEILEDGVDQYVSHDSSKNRDYVDKDLIMLDYEDLTHREANTVKKLVAEEWERDA